MAAHAMLESVQPFFIFSREAFLLGGEDHTPVEACCMLHGGCTFWARKRYTSDRLSHPSVAGYRWVWYFSYECTCFSTTAHRIVGQVARTRRMLPQRYTFFWPNFFVLNDTGLLNLVLEHMAMLVVLRERDVCYHRGTTLFFYRFFSS